MGGAVETPQGMKPPGLARGSSLASTCHTAIHNRGHIEWRARPDILGEENGVKGLSGADDARADIISQMTTPFHDQSQRERIITPCSA